MSRKKLTIEKLDICTQYEDQECLGAFRSICDGRVEYFYIEEPCVASAYTYGVCKEHQKYYKKQHFKLIKLTIKEKFYLKIKCQQP